MTTEATPMMMPSMVRKDRVFFMEMDLKAIFESLPQIHSQSTSCAWSAMIFPSDSRTTRRAVAAMPSSWVMRRMVVPSR